NGLTLSCHTVRSSGTEGDLMKLLPLSTGQIQESMKKCGAITEQVFCWSWNNQHPLVTMFVIP
ncbi:hypothetical protein, partial [Salmonella enterica]